MYNGRIVKSAAKNLRYNLKSMVMTGSQIEKKKQRSSFYHKDTKAQREQKRFKQ